MKERFGVNGLRELGQLELAVGEGDPGRAKMDESERGARREILIAPCGVMAMLRGTLQSTTCVYDRFLPFPYTIAINTALL